MNIETIQKLKENFGLRNIEVSYFETLGEAASQLVSTIPIHCTVGIGHSATLQKMDITHALAVRGNTIYDKELAKDKEECKIIKKKALLADWYITSANAISMDGRIVNVDHSGNRMAAITYGPDHVVIVVGKNKLTNTLQEAIQRVKNIASPMNAKRAGLHPPCTIANKCVDCVSKERVCNTLSIIEGQVDYDRIKLWLVNEDHGY